MLAGALIMAGLVGFSPGDEKPAGAGAADSADDGMAEAAWKPLSDRAADRKADPERLWRDLVAFRRAYPGTDQALKAAGVLARIPSPLDRLDPKTIPALERYGWQPKELVAVLGQHSGRNGGAAECLVYTPDGKSIVSGGNNSQLRFWEPGTMRLQRVLPHSHYIHAVAITRDGKLLACGSEDGLIRLWDLGGKEPKERTVLKVAAGTSPVRALAFTPNGKRLACNAEGGSIRLWDLGGKEPKEQHLLSGHNGDVRALAISADGTTLASGSNDKSVRLWDLTATPPKQRAALANAHGKEVSSLAFSPNGRTLASGGQDGTVWLWGVTGSPRQLAGARLAGVYSLGFAPGGRMLAAGCVDGSVHVFDVTGSQLRERGAGEGHAGVIYALAFSPDARSLATGSSDCTVRFWRVTVGTPVERTVTRGHLRHAYKVAFAPDGQMLASGGSDTTIRLWGLAQAQPKETVLKPAGSTVLGLDFSPDSATLASSHYDATVRFWRVAGAREFRQVKGLKEPAWSVAFAPNGYQVAGACALTDNAGFWRPGEGYSLHLWDVASGQEIRHFGKYKEPVLSVVFAPDGRRIVTGGVHEELRMTKYVPVDCAVRLWDVAGGEEVAAMEKHVRPVYRAVFSADGRHVISSAVDGTVLRWSPGQAGEPVVFEAMGEYASTLAVSPDGRSVAAGGGYGRIVLWDAATGKKRNEWKLNEGVTWLAFAPDSRHLAVAIVGGAVYVLRLAGPGG